MRAGTSSPHTGLFSRGSRVRCATIGLGEIERVRNTGNWSLWRSNICPLLCALITMLACFFTMCEEKGSTSSEELERVACLYAEALFDDFDHSISLLHRSVREWKEVEQAHRLRRSLAEEYAVVGCEVRSVRSSESVRGCYVAEYVVTVKDVVGRDKGTEFEEAQRSGWVREGGKWWNVYRYTSVEADPCEYWRLIEGYESEQRSPRGASRRIDWPCKGSETPRAADLIGVWTICYDPERKGLKTLHASRMTINEDSTYSISYCPNSPPDESRWTELGTWEIVGSEVVQTAQKLLDEKGAEIPNLRFSPVERSFRRSIPVVLGWDDEPEERPLLFRDCVINYQYAKVE